MTDREVMDAVNVNADEARKREEVKAAEAEAAWARWQHEEQARKKAAFRRADRDFGIRAVMSAGVLWGLMAAVDAELVSPVLAGALLILLFCNVSFRAGAWWQFRFNKGGR